MIHGKPQSGAVSSMKLPAHSTTLFGTHGVYLTLVGLKQPLNVGDRVPLTLVVDIGGKNHIINTEAEVKALELSYQHFKDPNVKDHR
jgi:copper(I)-binding protein